MKRKFFKNLPMISEWPLVVSIVGPTGTGKSSLAQKLADEYFHQTQIKPLLVSADAVAVYKDLNIGSAKPSLEEIKHYGWEGLDLFAPTENPTAKTYIQKVEPAITRSLTQNTPVIIVGGSMFYERALIDGMSPGVASDPQFQSFLSQLSCEELSKRLYNFDSRFQNKAHLNDRYRLTRYLDLVEKQGLDYDTIFGEKIRPPEWVKLWKETTTVLHGLDMPVADLCLRLTKRIDEMFLNGWVEECQSLKSRYPTHSPAFSSVGYAEIMMYLEGKIKESDLKNQILTRHLQLAKKQRTWMRGLEKTNS